MRQLFLTSAIAIAASAVALGAQQPTSTATPAAQATPRPASPPGSAQIQVAGAYAKPGGRYEGGKWIEITYNRPIKRGRDVFGSGADYGKTLNAGAPVWRAGANMSTRLNTEAALVIGGKTVPPGEYSLFVELKSPTEWTLIISSWGARKAGNEKTPGALWGSYEYTPEKDVVRVPMTVGKSDAALEQLTWGFCDVTETAGKIFLAWDKFNAQVPFTVAK